MPRKAKDKKEIIEDDKKTEKKSSSTGTTKTKNAAKKSTTTSKKTTSKSSSVAQKANSKAAASKTSKSSKKTSNTRNKTTTAKTATKKAETKTQKKNEIKKEKVVKESIKKEEKVKEETVIQKIKAFIAKIAAIQEEESQKTQKKEKNNTQEIKESKIETPYMLEYYDLPYRYNETVVKILAQTPKRLFVYWDISDKDKQKYLLAFGENFFEETYPVLLVHNEDMNYTFEVPINDFANSWYLDIKDSKSKYTIQLGRKFRKKPEMVNIVASTETENVVLYNDYVPIITSNALEMPNDCILFENIQSKVVYKNVKNGKESIVEINNLEFAKKMGQIYNIYDIYKEIYKNEMDNDCLTNLLNPSSMSSSVFR